MIDDIISVLTLAVFYPHNFNVEWLAVATVIVLVLVALSRARFYAGWPYLIIGAALWLCLHAAGVHAALTGIVLAACLPSRPAGTLCR